MNKVVFLDRDGTINVEKHYLHKIEDFEFLDGAVEGLKKLQDAGFLLIVVTNQSGIGRGYYKVSDYETLTQWMCDKLISMGVTISKVYYCPHLPDASVKEYAVDCECRKPALGMFHSAVNEFDIDITKSYAIGDKIRDLSICTEGATGFLIYSNDEVLADSNITTISGGLLEAADLILGDVSDGKLD